MIIRDIAQDMDPKLVRLVFLFPSLTFPEDEIGEKSLVNWVHSSYHDLYNQKIEKNEVHGCIGKLSYDGFFVRKSYGKGVILKPTHNYFLVKRGKKPVRRNITKEKKPLEYTEQSPIEINDKPLGDNECDPIPYHQISYENYLKSRINRYSGPDKELVSYFPAFYQLACNILNDRYTDWHTKILISTALGYYILEDDVIPDDKEFGYLDDLFILLYVLREIKKHVSPNLLEDNWEYEGDVLNLIDEIYADTHYIIQDYACDILHKVGLWKFKDLQLEEYSGTYQQKISKLASEKRELYGLLAYMVKILYRANLKSRKLSEIKVFLKKYGDYAEIERLVALSMADHQIEQPVDSEMLSFEQELEENLLRARINALIEEDSEY